LLAAEVVLKNGQHHFVVFLDAFEELLSRFLKPRII